MFLLRFGGLYSPLRRKGMCSCVCIVCLCMYVCVCMCVLLLYVRQNNKFAYHVIFAFRYGDIVPVSILGKIWASITCSLGVIVIALPITIVMSVFADSFHQVTSEQLLPSEVISKLYKHQKGLKKMFHDMQNSPELQQEAADGDHMATMECIDMLGDLVVKQLNALRTFLDVQIKREKIYENTNYLMEQQVS